jgi:hypothetical protein
MDALYPVRSGLPRNGLAACTLIALLLPGMAQSERNSGLAAANEPSRATAKPAPLSAPLSAPRDGQHDFDFEIGSWKTHISRLQHPMTGSTTWVELDGTSIVSKVWDGRANLVELDVRGPSGRIQGLSLRLYNPEARQWSLNFSNSAAGVLTSPTIGQFRNGRGEFFGPDTLAGRAIYVRFIIACANTDSCRFEQAFSDDGGKTWEVNWIATDTRIKEATKG